MTYWVKQHRDGRAFQQGVRTGQEAADLGDTWAGGLPVQIETPDGDQMSLEQFKKTVLGGVKFGDA